MKLNKNQTFVMTSGGTWAVFDALTSSFLVAFALMLGASNFAIGIIGAMPYLASLIIELPGAKLAEFVSRKKICVVAQLISRLSWVLIILIPYFFKTSPLIFLTVFFALIKITDLLTEPAWTSLIADLVPLQIRGRFFGMRNMLIGFAGMVAAVIGGFYLDLFSTEKFTGFSTMFSVAIIFGIIATYLFSKIKEPKNADHEHHHIKDFFLLDGDFKKFCTFAVCFNFAVMLASPFFSVFMLKNLQLSYSSFMLASAISTIARIIAQHRVGWLSDKFGNKQVALISVFGTAIVPFIFLFVTPENLWLMIVAQIVSGIVWAGTDLTMFNLLLDLTKAEKRASQVATYAMIIAVPNIIAPIIGGLAADYGQIYVLTGIPLIFTLSFVLRLFTSILLYSIHEPRAHKTYPLTHVFYHALALHPSRGFEYKIRVVVKKFGNKYGFLR